MSCTVDLRQMIASAALAAGVPPGIALAVASAESGICQWKSDGTTVITSSAGAIGVMQLMPATAAQLGVNAYDLQQNIQGGVRYLAQLYSKYAGSWALALAAYNWGPGNIDQGKPIPSSVAAYANGIIANAGVQAGAVQIAIDNQTAMAPDGTDTGTPDTAASITAAPAVDNTGTILMLGGLTLAAAWFFFGE